MDSTLILILLIFIQTFLYITKSDYIVDFLDVNWNVTKNTCDMFWEVSQPSRGVFAFSGFWDIKEDVNTDNIIAKGCIYYSKNGITYTLTPFQVPPTKFTDCLNTFYPLYFEDITKECCDNPIIYEEKFIPPLTKRNMTCNNCVLSGVNFPTHLRPGYYRILQSITGELEYELSFTLKLEYE